MALTIKNVVQLTKTGLVARYDRGGGLFVYSPYTGFIYAVCEEDAANVLLWLNKKTKDVPAQEYVTTLGIGWSESLRCAKYHRSSHLLPSRNKWQVLPKPEAPLLINWFITGNCPLACKYCYAEDLMRGKEKEPTEDDIVHIAENILSYQPIVVVLTGGDPLFSPRLQKAVEVLHKKVGIVVDTSGYTFQPNHLALFKKYGVAVRISLDSEIPKLNQKYRVVCPEHTALVNSGVTTLDAAVKCLCACIDAGLTVSVQTVATHNNVNNMEALGDKLFRLGVRSWRVLKVALWGEHLKKYRKHLVSDKQSLHIIEGNLLVAQRNRWKSMMALQITHNKTPNAVILVSPSGIFYTESDTISGKVMLDKDNPTKPRSSVFFDKININGHAARYLNLTQSD